MNRRSVSPYVILPLLALIGLSALLLDLRQPSTPLAWLFLASFNALTLAFDFALSSRLDRLPRWFLRFFLALFTGGASALLAQVEARFAEEEFFVALQALVLAAYWLLAALALALLRRARARPTAWPRRAQLLLLIACLAAAVFPAAAFLHAYQASFYPQDAPAYPSVSPGSPFLCAPAPPSQARFSGEEVFQRLLALVEANPEKTAAEYAMLALGGRRLDWAQSFRAALLQEASSGRFAGPANSVKYGQYEAGVRAYYYPLIVAAFPELFTAAEQQLIRQWFAAINRRAFTVEWVDWLYSLALADLPQGPYQNQESGAGLLAILEANGLADPALSERNRQYLAARPRGWEARFRVSDDAAVYQPEWIQNAYFQALYAPESLNETNRRLSFEWLLTQAPPDGAPLLSNHLGAAQIASSAYLGAALTGDERYIWLAGRAVEYLEKKGGFLTARPGVDEPLALVSRSPETGACLLYGDSGLPNQPGPLAPDKLVFRGGWNSADPYLLVNLRFTGWHRYKATGAVTVLAQDGLLSGDDLGGQTFSWLPTGRSLFRDKRIPRENLNGLLIPRSGLSQVIYTLTRLGGPWAQDPPYYAGVLHFTSGDEMDSAAFLLEDWRGWRQRRDIFFYHNGPIILFDYAVGPQHQEAAIAWHLRREATPQATLPAPPRQAQRILLRQGESPAELLLLPLTTGQIESYPAAGESSLSALQFHSAAGGKISLATVFLTQAWFGAEAAIESTPHGDTLILRQGEQIIRLPLPVDKMEVSAP